MNTKTILLVEDSMKGYEIGASSFVRKPVDFAEFAETAARIGIYRLMTNTPPER